MAQQTAIEWLFEQYKKHGILFSQDEEQAKQMEKEQIINAFEEGQKEEAKEPFWTKGNNYYHQTYGDEST